VAREERAQAPSCLPQRAGVNCVVGVWNVPLPLPQRVCIDVPRTLVRMGSLFEIVRLDGTREGLSDADLEKFSKSFPAERV
jgi:hypothetical protein